MKRNADKTPKKVGRPKRSDKDNTTVHSAEKGTKPGELRKTYIVSSNVADKIDGISFVDGKTVKTVVHEALTTHIDKWEKKNGPAPTPGKR